MKNTMIKIAAAAVIILAVIIGLNSFQSNITFAQVVDPLLKARTIAYDIIIGNPAEGAAMHDIVIDRKIRRTFYNMPLVMIIDTDNSRMLVLQPEYKGAAYTNIEETLAENHRDFLYFLRKTLGEAVNHPQQEIEELGRGGINGVEVVGFKLVSEADTEEVIVWADSDTALPVQVSIRQGEMNFTLGNILFDIPADESLISMEVPDAYTLQNRGLDLSNVSEEDFISVLRIHVEGFLEDVFRTN